MRFLVAPDKFRNAVDAPGAAAAIAAGIRAADPAAEIDICPMADGGEGTGSLLAQALGARPQQAFVFDPLGRIRCAPWWHVPQTDLAIVEMAQASGLALLADERGLNPIRTPTARERGGSEPQPSGSGDDPDCARPGAEQSRAATASERGTEPRHAQTGRTRVLHTRAQGSAGRGLAGFSAADTTSFGTGQLLRAALEAGARRIWLAAGGSATTDGGAGCLQALGWRLIDRRGRVIEPPACGRILAEVHALRPPERAPDFELMVLCDVDNPLVGPRGAARVFGPQKGADARQVALLDANLLHWSEVLERSCGVSVASVPHSGAAGGLPAGLHAALGARLTSGFDAVAQALRLGERIRACDVVLTGEGRLDAQTGGGKVVAGVARLAREAGRPVVAVVGAASLQISNSAMDTQGQPAAGAGWLAAAPVFDGPPPAWSADLGVIVITPAGLPLEAALAATRENLFRAAQALARRLAQPGEGGAE